MCWAVDLQLGSSSTISRASFAVSNVVAFDIAATHFALQAQGAILKTTKRLHERNVHSDA